MPGQDGRTLGGGGGVERILWVIRCIWGVTAGQRGRAMAAWWHVERGGGVRRVNIKQILRIRHEGPAGNHQNAFGCCLSVCVCVFVARGMWQVYYLCHSCDAVRSAHSNSFPSNTPPTPPHRIPTVPKGIYDLFTFNLARSRGGRGCGGRGHSIPVTPWCIPKGLSLVIFSFFPFSFRPNGHYPYGQWLD